MGNEVNINIKIANLQGETKNLAKAADSDGSGAIDNAYEHSLFTQYCNNAGVDASDYSAKYTAKDTQKAENQLIKEQKYSGSTKENTANLEQYEATWQQAMKTAYKAVGNDPAGRAKLSEFIKNKPKLQNFTSMADYAMQLGQAIEKMGNIAETDLKDFAVQLTQGQTEELKADNAEQTATLHDEHENLQESISQLQQDVENGVATIENRIKNAEGRIEATVRYEGGKTRRVVINSKNQIIGVVHQEGAATRQTVRQEGAATRQTVRQEGAATRQTVRQEGAATRYTVRYEGAATRQTVKREAAGLHDHMSWEGAATRQAVRQEGAETRDEVDAAKKQIIDTDDPVYIKRSIKKVRDTIGKGAKAAIDFATKNGVGALRVGQTISDYVNEHANETINIPGFGLIQIAQLAQEGFFDE